MIKYYAVTFSQQVRIYGASSQFPICTFHYEGRHDRTHIHVL